MSRSAASFVPESIELSDLRSAAAVCHGCDLWERATQTVFGEGDAGRDLMLVGEQPGDHEDREGAPFVGPAGQVLDRALHEAGIPRTSVYLTNAVKHFRWEARGKRRLHKRPSGTQVAACRPWLSAEIDAVRPSVIVAMGAVAVQSLLGTAARVRRDRGQIFRVDVGPVLVTIHPSAILRAPDPESRSADLVGLVHDLRTAADCCAAGG